MPVSPLLLGLIATAGLLAAIVCLVLAALYRRHYSRPCPRPASRVKHVPLEAVLASEDRLTAPDAAILSVAGARATTHPLVFGGGGVMTCGGGGVGAIECRPPVTEDTDPDIIRNQYERRPIHGFMKVYEPSGPKHTEEDEDLEETADGDDYDFRHVAKETHIPNHTVYHSLQRQRTALKGPSPLNSGLSLGLPATLAHPGHKHRPEVVTTSNRIQESCI